MLDGYRHPQFRYRRFGGGYRREDVELALTELRLTLRQLENDLRSLCDRNRELEGELRAARSEIGTLRAKEYELSQTVGAALRRAAEIEDVADARAREILVQAEEAAMRIRSEASRRIEDSSAQFTELLGLKDTMLEAMRTMVGDFDQAISRVERGEHLFPGGLRDASGEARTDPAEAPPVPPYAPPAEPAPAPPPVTPAYVAGTVSIPAASPPPAQADEPLFETLVELDAGPFSDFVALSAFERSLAHLPKVEDVYVRRLADDRALIELTLSEVAPLLQTMRELLPYALEVRSANRSKIVIEVARHRFVP